ncbi:nucleotidyltransferase domain-containing protein [uncultured Friedmanniella sp.]|uniref:nucleotidyltransferase domain-containing protein n=1 Tax=uncultured Friedmanniella sp. TaxID=335381 RepID=UPI0035CB4855
MAAERAGRQLQAVGRLQALLEEHGIHSWLFGGWAVDFHAGRVTRDHDDIDLAVWRTDLGRLDGLLRSEGWTHHPEPDEDGYTGYERAGLRVEVAFLAVDEEGIVHTPLADGRGDWPVGSFGDDVAEVGGVRARVVSRASLIEDKSGPRDDPAAAAKDRADVATLTALG